MPALRLFGRKWLAASDDLVFPCLFEVVFRIVWLVLFAVAVDQSWSTIDQCSDGRLAVQIYLLGSLALVAINILLSALLVNRSAQGSISDVESRKWVVPLLVVKIVLILPELALNVFGTIWAFCNLIKCTADEKFTKIVVEVIVLFNWVIFALIVFGMAIVFDPMGSTKYRPKGQVENVAPAESALHRKVSRLWMRRFRWIFCCLRKDEFGHEAFTQVASLLSTLFRGIDLVPSDFMAGCVLLRIRQKRETREMRRIRMINDDGPRYSTDLARVFATTPAWMTLKNAQHYVRFAIASYGWPFVCYMHCCSGPFKLIRKSTCCACFRSRSQFVVEDNCCLCHFAGVKSMSRIRADDVLLASFKNHVFELPFCVLADHATKSIVVSVRGSFSFRDIFTDLTANSERFEAPGFPPDSSAHRGMIAGAEILLKRLRETQILDRAFNTYSEYKLVLTGHSLGAGIAILAAARLRPKYPDLQVFAYATPAGLLTREAARFTEAFVFTVGVGDDFVMRLSVESIENLRTMIIETIRACQLPKYRIMLNGFGYALFGIPSRDLENTWKDVTQISNCPNDAITFNNNNNNVIMSHEQQFNVQQALRGTDSVESTTSVEVRSTGGVSTDLSRSAGGVAAAGGAGGGGAVAAISERPAREGRSSPMYTDNGISTVTGYASSIEESALLTREISLRRFAKVRLYSGGRILHIVRRKKTELEKKSQTGGPTFEMRWASPEDFTELQVMPRMFLDHFPDNIFRTLTRILEEQKSSPTSITSIHEL